MSVSLKSICLVLCLACSVHLYAQERLLKLTSKRNKDNSVTISYEKKDNGSFTVFLKFKELSNSSLSVYEYVATGHTGELVTLKPIRDSEPIRYSYSYRYVRGKPNPKVNESIIYALPYAAHTSVRVTESTYLAAKATGRKTPPDWKSYNFLTKQQQAVTACRKGEVVQTIDEHDTDDLGKFVYTSERNTVYIEHEDGTIMRYAGMEKNSMKVKVGQTVFPGCELGLNAKAGENSYKISCLLFYIKTNDLDTATGEKRNYRTAFITPQFAVNNGEKSVLDNKSTYTAFLDDAMIMQEMNKKELKKYKKK